LLDFSITSHRNSLTTLLSSKCSVVINLCSSHRSSHLFAASIVSAVISAGIICSFFSLAVFSSSVSPSISTYFLRMPSSNPTAPKITDLNSLRMTSFSSHSAVAAEKRIWRLRVVIRSPPLSPLTRNLWIFRTSTLNTRMSSRTSGPRSVLM
jgi:hypothetical protein